MLKAHIFCLRCWHFTSRWKEKDHSVTWFVCWERKEKILLKKSHSPDTYCHALVCQTWKIIYIFARCVRTVCALFMFIPLSICFIFCWWGKRWKCGVGNGSRVPPTTTSPVITALSFLSFLSTVRAQEHQQLITQLVPLTSLSQTWGPVLNFIHSLGAIATANEFKLRRERKRESTNNREAQQQHL